MHLALEAIGLRAGDEVITTPYTFAATAEVIRYFDAHPVFVDVDRDTLMLDPALIEAAITERTRAIIPVHIAGLPADTRPAPSVDPYDQLLGKRRAGQPPAVSASSTKESTS